VQDPQELGVPGIGVGRDPERTPMQWDASPNAGFTTGTPWLPLADDYQRFNVAEELADPRSMLSLYQRLIELRRATPALEIGSYAAVPADGDLLAYIRESRGRRLLIALNLGSQEQIFDLGALRGQILLSTHMDRENQTADGRLALRADEGLIVELA
jgi:alpha-glucosidase